MAAYMPPGWPAGVHPPGSEGFTESAIAWLLEIVPPDYRLHGVLRRHPAALAALARHHTAACVEGARQGYRTVRTELAEAVPPHAVDAVLAAYRTEGRRLAAAAKSVELVERALNGACFTPKLLPERIVPPHQRRVTRMFRRRAEARWSKSRPTSVIITTMAMPAETPVPISEAKTHLSELARRAHLQHERITLTRNGTPEAVLVSVDDLEGMEMTLEILGDSDAAARISDSLAALQRGERGTDLDTVRADFARRRHTGT